MGVKTGLGVLLFLLVWGAIVATFFALPFVVGALLSHWLGWSMWLTTPIATVFLFATGILRINFTPHQ